MKESIDDGATLLDLYEGHFSSTVRYARGFKEYMNLRVPPRNTMPEVSLYYGAPRTGKSARAHREYPDAYHHDGSKWWDGYCAHDAVIIDDFYGSIAIHRLLKLLDRYPCQVETKGGYTQFVPTKIVITSNHHVDEWYPDASASQLAALRARFSEIIFYAPGTIPCLTSSSPAKV